MLGFDLPCRVGQRRAQYGQGRWPAQLFARIYKNPFKSIGRFLGGACRGAICSRWRVEHSARAPRIRNATLRRHARRLDRGASLRRWNGIAAFGKRHYAHGLLLSKAVCGASMPKYCANSPVSAGTEYRCTFRSSCTSRNKVADVK